MLTFQIAAAVLAGILKQTELHTAIILWKALTFSKGFTELPVCLEYVYNALFQVADDSLSIEMCFILICCFLINKTFLSLPPVDYLRTCHDAQSVLSCDCQSTL